MFWPCETRTSTCLSFATISSGLYRFLAIAVLLDVKDIPQVGPLQWGWITNPSDRLLINAQIAAGYALTSSSTVASGGAQATLSPCAIIMEHHGGLFDKDEAKHRLAVTLNCHQ